MADFYTTGSTGSPSYVRTTSTSASSTPIFIFPDAGTGEEWYRRRLAEEQNNKVIEQHIRNIINNEVEDRAKRILDETERTIQRLKNEVEELNGELKEARKVIKFYHEQFIERIRRFELLDFDGK